MLFSEHKFALIRTNGAQEEENIFASCRAASVECPECNVEFFPPIGDAGSVLASTLSVTMNASGRIRNQSVVSVPDSDILRQSIREEQPTPFGDGQPIDTDSTPKGEDSA